MYDELVKRLRCLKYGSCPDCPMWHSEEVEPHLWRERCAAIDAADAIEERCQQVDNFAEEAARLYAKQPKWIPVTEALPELHDAEYLDEVTGELIRYKESAPILIWLAKGGFMDIGVYERSDAVDDFCYQGVPHTVTYWMPLPEAPKEEQLND